MKGPKFEGPKEPAQKSETGRAFSDELVENEKRDIEYKQQGRELFGVVTGEIASYLRGEGPFRRADLSQEERALLERMSAEVRKAKQNNPDASAVNLDLSQNPDAYRIWNGLVNRIVQERLTP